jgi:hypothetical protein
MNDIDEGFWIRPQDHMPDDLIPVETERDERTKEGYVTGHLITEILLFSAGFWYTVGLKKQVGPSQAIKRWRKL